MSAFHVDLDAFAANIAVVRATVAPAELMLVVKDDAYGHGLAPIVRRAWAEGVRWYGAFDVSTGSAVRHTLGSAARIFVWMAASAVDVQQAVTDALDIGVGDAALLDDVARAAEAAGATARVHLKIDTGLHRNGVRPEEWPAVVAHAAELHTAGRIDVVGVWSHIAEASDADDDAARAVFDEAVDIAQRGGLNPTVRHLAASAAAFARAEFRYDLVRVGAFCYGIRSAGGVHERDLGLTPVARLEASVTAVEDDAARVDVGRLDGLPSSLGGLIDVATPAGARRVREITVEAIVDAWPEAAPGDTVTIFGAADTGALSATDIAERIDTIGEEIVLRVSPLIPRTYRGMTDGAAPVAGS